MGNNAGICLVALLALAMLAGMGAAANVHMVSYRTEPVPHPHQDFDLCLTFKNDVEFSVDDVEISLQCPESLQCPNATITMPPYGIQEVCLPIRSNSSGGVENIAVNWKDDSTRFVYNETSGVSQSEKNVYSTSIPLYVKKYSVSNLTLGGEFYADEDSNFTVLFNAEGLNNVQVSLYSDCISFSTPLFYFGRLDGQVNVTSPARVNCDEGNHQAVLTLSSDELSYNVPFTVDVEKRPHAKITVLPQSGSALGVGKDYYRVLVNNAGGKAEKLSLTVLSGPATNSPDVLYLGDFANGDERAAVFEIETKKAGAYPVSVEAKWVEGNQQYSEVFEYGQEFSDRGLGIIPYVVGICAIAIIYLAYAAGRKKA
ncbi:Uncharacterised protein [uncultured archaeon]|nr:Uncharacterised protein [uncultured archaeon]